MITRKMQVIGIMALILAAMTACDDKYNEPYRDAPRGNMNSSAADTITMPDGFSNVATKCDHGNRVYVVYHGDDTYAAITVVPNDATCAK